MADGAKRDGMIVLRIGSPWHPGTGLGDGATADAVVRASHDGLPELPGRTLKGLLRAAVRMGERAGVAPEGTVASWFGRDGIDPSASAGGEALDALESARFSTSAGRLRVASAWPGGSRAEREAWQAWARSDPGAQRTLAHLKMRLSSTAIDERGQQARRGTLRTVEAWVPMTLAAPLQWREPLGKGDSEAIAPSALWNTLDTCAQLFLRGLGSGRNRGLGRVLAHVHGLEGDDA